MAGRVRDDPAPDARVPDGLARHAAVVARVTRAVTLVRASRAAPDGPERHVRVLVERVAEVGPHRAVARELRSEAARLARLVLPARRRGWVDAKSKVVRLFGKC
jgi:hypothetical protein